MIPTALVEEIRGTDALVREFEGAVVAFLHSIETNCCEVRNFIEALSLAGEAEFLLEQLRAASSLIAPMSREGNFIAGIERVYAEADAMLEAIELLLEVDDPPFTLSQLEQEIIAIGEEVRARVRTLGRSGFGIEPPPYRDEDIEELYIAVGLRDLLGWAYYFTARRSIGGRARMLQPKDILQATREADLFLERVLARLVLHGVRLPERPSPPDFFWCRGTYAAQPSIVVSKQADLSGGDKNKSDNSYIPAGPIELRATGIFREIQRDTFPVPTVGHGFQQPGAGRREGSGSTSIKEQQEVLPPTFISRLGETVSNPHYDHDVATLNHTWDLSKVISPETIFIVTGATVAVELLDRPVAEALRDAIDSYGDPKEGRRGIIISDLWYWQDTETQLHSVISIGGPRANSLTAALDSQGSVWGTPEGFNGSFLDDTPPRVALWGESSGQTRGSVEFFVKTKTGLPSLITFLALCWHSPANQSATPAKHLNKLEAMLERHEDLVVYLRQRLIDEPDKKAVSAFLSREETQTQISKALALYEAEIVTWIGGKEEQKVLPKYNAGKPIGLILRRGANSPDIASYIVPILLRDTKAPKGYWVKAALAVNA